MDWFLYNNGLRHERVKRRTTFGDTRTEKIRCAVVRKCDV